VDSTTGVAPLILNKDGGNVGIGKTTTNSKLDVSGSAIISGSFVVSGSISIKDGTQQNGYVLSSDSDGKATWRSPAGFGAGSSGTSGTSAVIAGTIGVLPKYATSTALGNSIVSESAGKISIGGYLEVLDEVNLSQITGGLYAGTIGENESGVGYNMDAGGHKGLGFYHDGAVGRIKCIDNASGWHPISSSAYSHTWQISSISDRIMILDNTGNLGIGKVTPVNARLDVSGSAIVSGNLAVTGSTIWLGNGTKGIYLSKAGTGVDLASSGVPIYMNYGINQNIYMLAGGSTGFLGIGTDSPTYPLRLQSALNSWQYVLGDFDNGNANLRMMAYGDTSYISSFVDSTTGVAPLILNKDGGNVGIGKTTTNSKLDVSGSAIVSGAFTVTGSVKFTSGSAANYVLASDAIGNASWKSANEIIANYNPANIKYVSPDFTSSVAPYYPTIVAAITASVVSGSLIVVYPGTYNARHVLKNAVDWYCYPGVTIRNDTTNQGGFLGCVIDDGNPTGASTTCSIWGHADIIKYDSGPTVPSVMNEACAIMITTQNSNVTIHANIVESNAWSTFAVFGGIGAGSYGGASCSGSLYADTIIGRRHIATVDCDSGWMHVEAREIYNYASSVAFCMLTMGQTARNSSSQYVKADNIYLYATDASRGAIYNYGSYLTPVKHANNIRQEIHGNVFAYNSVCAANSTVSDTAGVQYLCDGIYHCYWNDSSANAISVGTDNCITTLKDISIVTDNVSAYGISSLYPSTPVTTYGNVTSNRINSSNIIVTNATPYQPGINVQGNVVITGALNISGSTTVVGTSTAISFVETSGRIFKENINELKPQLYNVLQLNPVAFDYKHNKQHSIGLIAEDVAKIYPEFVNEDETGINYSKMVSVLVQSIKELKFIVDNQQQEIEELKRKII
jgi:hypothetical protein